VQRICAILDARRPDAAPHARLIAYVDDRPGHDFRYAIDAATIRAELGWQPSVTLEEGLRRTVAWYLDNEPWWREIRARGHRAERIGLAKARG
jgi:dTDP-glucose 4,6-dehydratase